MIWPMCINSRSNEAVRGGGQPITISPALGGGQVVTYRANAANSGCDGRHFKDHTAFAEFFESTEFIDVKIGVINLARLHSRFIVTLA